jgi:calcyclin binding protein
VAPPPPTASLVKYTTIDRFAFDDGGYKNGFVTLYIELPGVGSIPKDNVKCEFGTSHFDMVVENLNGKSYRLKKDHLEKDIVVEKSKYLIKADKILVKLAKVKSDYGSYDYWSQLTDNKRGKSSKKVDNPASGIMDMMKDMYEKGDDNMKKMIGETMMKQRSGEYDQKNAGLGDLGSGFDDNV